jgi:hypothetical protein
MAEAAAYDYEGRDDGSDEEMELGEESSDEESSSDASSVDDNRLQRIFADSDTENDEDFVGFDDIGGGAIVLGQIAPLREPALNNELPADIEIGWTADDTQHAIRPFEGETGLQRDMDSHGPKDFFDLLFEDDMWDILVEQTNLYFHQSHPDLEVLSPHSRLRKWRDVTKDEMKVFVALSIAMGLVTKLDIESYWSTDETDETPLFGKYMPKDRYLLILWNIHLNDNALQVGRGNPGFDPLGKVRPFITMIRRTFRDAYRPNMDLSFDEGSCPWRGRLRWKVYNPSKPNKFHMKLYQVCESESGWVSGFDVYTGSTECAEYAAVVTDAELTQTSKIVVGMLAFCGLLDKGYHVYMDNYYSSPELMDELELHGTYACGTLRVNRRDVPKALKATKCTEGQAIFRRRDHLLALKFHDKRDVHMISSIHQATTVVIQNRHGHIVRKPSAVVDYVKKMGGVDLSDQIQQYYGVFLKSHKYWKKLFSTF